MLPHSRTFGKQLSHGLGKQKRVFLPYSRGHALFQPNASELGRNPLAKGKPHAG
ncbi:hypothetical protein HMPREF9061_01132 [Actinomyces sp. oral taxon 181 str. F0379]|nr:hypothetical protein HMPREF9061_01132 [Actinomyces sp. oral taxon 181 str. F0379]